MILLSKRTINHKTKAEKEAWKAYMKADVKVMSSWVEYKKASKEMEEAYKNYRKELAKNDY